MKSDYVGFAYDPRSASYLILKDVPFLTDLLAPYFYHARGASFSQSFYFDAPIEQDRSEIRKIWVRYCPRPLDGSGDDRLAYTEHPVVWYRRPLSLSDIVCYVLEDDYWVKEDSVNHWIKEDDMTSDSVTERERIVQKNRRNQMSSYYECQGGIDFHVKTEKDAEETKKWMEEVLHDIFDCHFSTLGIHVVVGPLEDGLSVSADLADLTISSNVYESQEEYDTLLENLCQTIKEKCLQYFGGENISDEQASVYLSGYYCDRDPDISAFVWLKEPALLRS
jgi:hypothetical protein